MKEKLEQVLADLKAIGISVAKVESELNFSNGLLGKAKNGKANLSEEKLSALISYWESKMPPVSSEINPTKDEIEAVVRPKPQMVVTENGLKEPNLTDADRKMREIADKINKDYGVGTVMRLGDLPDEGYDVVSTGSLKLDAALGIGGFPKGRIIEIYGAESSGKTTIATHVIANAQKNGVKCLLVDAENSFDPEYAANIGVKIEELYYCQPSYGEQGLEVADRYISDGKVGVVVIDSVAALIPKAELEGEMGDNKMGLHARLMSQALRKITSSVSKNKVICIFINQIRNKIGVMYGSPEVTTGGMALQFYASMRLRVSRSTQIKDGDLILGNLTVV